uniref:Uncharacterized protein n=1 Tax=Callorhinchus milii TaxID=7868 RepID=A0A4W3GL95_CALMI
VISWEEMMVQLEYCITEAARAILSKDEELPLPLIGKLLKFHLLWIKQKDMQRRENERRLEFATLLFEDIACLIYDCIDWKRQYLNYINNMQMCAVPEAFKTETSSRTTKPTPAEVDMRYYNDLMNVVPLESLSVPLILHCILEQVIASEENRTPPSEFIPEPREDGLNANIVDHIISVVLKLSVSEKEKRYLNQPLLLNHHDNLTWRTHHLKICEGFDIAKVEQEMMKKLFVAQALNFSRPSPEDDKKRLAGIQELMYYCTNERMTNSEVERIFKQFVFESMKLTEVKKNGELERLDKPFFQQPESESSYIPWDDPVRFAKDMRDFFSVKKIDSIHEEQKDECAGNPLLPFPLCLWSPFSSPPHPTCSISSTCIYLFANALIMFYLNQKLLKNPKHVLSFLKATL